MEPVENWAIVHGVITDVRASEDEITVVLNVSKADDFEDFPNLFSWASGQRITVLVPKEATPPSIGSRVDWRLRLVSPGTSKVHPSSWKN